MTNKEKHFGKASIDDTANILLELSGKDRGCGNCVLRDKYCDTKSEEDCITNIKNWLSREAQLTADEMFEELGCEFHSKQPNDIVYSYKVEKYKKYDINIRVMILGSGYIKSAKQGTPQYLLWVTEAEDKAIHKKIEELKNERDIV